MGFEYPCAPDSKPLHRQVNAPPSGGALSAEQNRVHLPDGTEKSHTGQRGEPVSRELDRPSFHQESLHCKSRNPTNWPKQSKGLFTHDLEILEVT